jgi:hypothetical protein
VFEVAVSVDRAGILEYWTGPSTDYKFPKCMLFESKLDTDLFEFANSKILVQHFTHKQSVSLIQLLSHHYKCTSYFSSVEMS